MNHKLTHKEKTILEFLNKCKKYALSKKGMLVSTAYINAKEQLLWKCSDVNHPTFSMSYFNAVKKERWCPACAKDRFSNKYIENINKILLEKGGVLINNLPKTVTHKTLLKIKCSNKEHNPWNVTYGNFFSHNTWCPECAGKFSKTTFENKILEYAKTNQGTLISGSYITQSSRFSFKCLNSTHKIFDLSYKSIQKGVWCKSCSQEQSIKNKQHYLENAKTKAMERGGKLLSDIYLNSKSKLKWKCSNVEHPVFESNYDNVVRSDKWCPRCSGIFTKEELFVFAKKIAKNKGGKLLSNKVNNIKEPLQWKCNVSTHGIFNKSLNNIKTYNSWCPECHAAKNVKEIYTKIILENLLNVKFEKCRPKWNVNHLTNKLLELDGYNEELGFAFEFQGRQHFIDIFQNNSLEKQQIRDKIKKENCKNNNVFLLEVKDEKRVRTPIQLINQITQELNKYNILYSLNIDSILKEINEAYIVKDGYSNLFCKTKL